MICVLIQAAKFENRQWNSMVMLSEPRIMSEIEFYPEL